MFRTKLLVALLLAPPFIWVWWQGFPYLHVLLAVFSIVAANEVATMAAGKDDWATRIAAVLGSLALYLPMAFPKAIPWSQSEALLLALLLAFIAHLISPGAMETVAARTGASMLGAVYGGVPIGYLIWVRDIPSHGRGLAFMALSLSWFCDTFAYFGGRVFGRTKLYAKMSPNKTVEGLLCGAIAAGIVAYIVVRVAEIPWSSVLAVGVGLFSAVWGQVGDLCESMLKRSFGVKDTGGFLPGHGGVLDRFDAVLFVAPLIYCVHRLSG